MVGAALQRLGIAIILVGGIHQLTRAAAWEIVEPNSLLEIGLALTVLGFVVTVVRGLDGLVGPDRDDPANE